MLTIEKLKTYGADVEDGVSRCMGNEDFYLKMVNLMLAEDSASKLKAAIDAKDLDLAFENAHALKGVSSNLSLTPLSKPTIEITELLRSRTDMDYTDLVNTITDQWDKLVELTQ